jgi:hypothetical protein
VERFVVRVWVPDEPGSLATLADRVARAGGNLVGVEVLERTGGQALDELMIEVESPGHVDPLTARVASMIGARIEEIRPVAPDTEEHSLRVIETALGILSCVRPTAALGALVEAVPELFDADWCALVDDNAGRIVMETAAAPPARRLLEMANGSKVAPHSGPGTRVEVLTRPVEEVGFTLCIGRPIPFRRRESREIDMLVRVTERTCRSVRSDRIPTHWAAKGGGVFGA